MRQFQNGRGGAALIDGEERAGNGSASSSPWRERWTVVPCAARQRMEAVAALGLVWPKEEERAGGLGQPEATAREELGGWAGSMEFTPNLEKEGKINLKLILNYPRL
jgi:hypothetical protein